MSKRKIINIDEEKCTGCGECIPNCPEGAIQIIDGKARLVSDLFCDGLGACLGHCPEGAITIEERDAAKYEEREVMKNIVKQGENVIKAHLGHLKEHKQTEYLKQAMEYLKENNIDISIKESTSGKSAPCGCPSAKVMDLKGQKRQTKVSASNVNLASELANWPIQLMLVPSFAPFLKGADILIAADCVGFSYPNLHQDLIKGKVLLVGCPKFDDLSLYKDKITAILKGNNIKSITYAHMEVPCCSGLIDVIKSSISESKSQVPFKDITIGIKGELIQ